MNKQGEHIPFAPVTPQGTTLGSITDASGHYNMTKLPEENHVLKVNSLKPKLFETTRLKPET